MWLDYAAKEPLFNVIFFLNLFPLSAVKLRTPYSVKLNLNRLRPFGLETKNGIKKEQRNLVQIKCKHKKNPFYSHTIRETREWKEGIML